MSIGGSNYSQTVVPIAAAARRKCILVLGMHRSGTSALTRVLSLLGAELPKHLLGANISNPTGHWESRPLVDLQDEMLAEAGSRWDDWRAFDPDALSPERREHYKLEIVRTLAEEFGDAPLFIVKDPRICRLMPLWRDVLAELHAQIQFVLPIRNPLEVGRSLVELYGIPLSTGCLVWLRHVLEAERETRGSPRVFVHYQDLLSDPARTAASVAAQFREDWLAGNERSEREIASFIDPDLRHQVAELEQLRHPVALHSWLSETYEALAVLVRRPNDEMAQSRLDRVWAVFDPASVSLAPVVAARDAALRERDGRIAALDRALVARETTLREQDGQIATLERMAATRESALRERDEKLGALDQALAARETTLRDQDTKIAALDQALAARETTLRDQDSKIAALDQTLAARETTLRDQDTKIAALDQALTARETTLRERDEKIAALERSITRLETTLKEREARIAALGQLLAGRVGEVAVLQERMAEKIAELADCEARLAACEATIRGLHASTSWRVTAPLRAARRLVGRP